MENSEITFYVCAHKVFDKSDIIAQLPNHKIIYNTTCDNKLNNLKTCYGEMYTVYDLYINHRDELPDFIGLEHYRRFFDDFENIYDSLKNNINDIALINRALLGKQSIYQYYCMHHSKQDIDLIINIIKELYPEYAEDTDIVLDRHYMYVCNMFVMSKDNFIKYCDWLFPILDKFNDIRNFTSYDDVRKYILKHASDYPITVRSIVNGENTVNYQGRLHGFICERIFNIFIHHNFKNILELKMITTA